MDVGTLAAYMDIDDRAWTSGLSAADRKFEQFGADVDRELDALSKLFEHSDQVILDDLEKTYSKMGQAVDEAFAEAAREAQQGSKKIGKAVEDGIDDGLDGAKSKARSRGGEAGDEFGGGLDEKGRASSKAAGEGMMGSLKGLGWAAAGAAIGAVLMDAFTEALDAEKAVDKLSAQIGATPEMSKDFGKAAGDLYAQAYGESVGDVAEALRSVWQSGLIPEDAGVAELEAITAKAMNFATVIGEDVTKATRAAAKMIKTGLADSADQAFDILTRGAQQGANEAEDLLDTFSEYPTMFRDLGISGEQAMGLITQGLRAGARDSDTVADALKEFAIRAQDASTTSAAGFEAIGLNAKEMTAIFARGGPEASKALDTVLDRLRNMKDPVERNAAAVALFGTKAEDLADSLFALDPSEAVAALGQVEGAADRMGETLSDNASTRIESFKRSLEQGLVSFIGNNVLPSLSALVDGLKLSGVPQAIENIVTQGRELIGGIVEDVRNWAATHGEQIDRIVAGGRRLYDEVTKAVSETISFVQDLWEGNDWIDAVATKIEGTIRMFEGLVEMIRGVVQIIAGIMSGDWSKVWDGVQGIVEGAIDATIGTIDNLVGGMVELLGGNWQEIKDSAREAWDETVQTFKDAGQWVSDAASWAAALPGRIGTWFGQVKDAAVDKLEALGTWITVELPAQIGAGLSSLGEKMRGWISAGLEGMKWALTDGIEWAIAWAIVLPYKLVQAGAALGEQLNIWVGQAWEWMKTTAETKTSELLEWATGIPGRIVDAVGELNARIGEWASTAWQNAKDTASSKAQELIDWARGLPSRIVEAVSDLNSRVGDWARRAWQSAKDGAEQKGSELVQWAKDLPGRIVREIGELGSKLWSTGRDLIEGLIRGIKETAGRIADSVLGPIRDTIAKTKALLGISSPSKVMAEIGVNMGEGLALGIESTRGLVADSLAGLAKQTNGFGAQLAAGMTGSGTPLPPSPQGVGGTSAYGMNGPRGDESRSLVHIENYHPPKPDDPHATAQELDWISKAGG